MWVFFPFKIMVKCVTSYRSSSLPLLSKRLSGIPGLCDDYPAPHPVLPSVPTRTLAARGLTQWNQAVPALLCLAHSTWQAVLTAGPGDRTPCLSRLHSACASWRAHVLSVPSPSDRRLGCSRLVATVANDAGHTGTRVPVQTHCFGLRGARPRTGPAGSHGRSMCFYF